ncbi:thermonuclease family protein [uncultured Tateyamaria sp.]|uniref:thermonuclease family protein n=1 Tax=uncultured Tateyamaria sp. TaxID=455651 RepID=UPI00262E0DD2|nr:thermonuclease family protein [uncultured Tateyamaria sp.]
MKRTPFFHTTLIVLAAITISVVLDTYLTSGFEIGSDRIRVVDGDTVAIGDVTYRLTGYDTPETYLPRCAFEKDLGQRATNRLQALISSVETIRIEPTGRDDYYGRELAGMMVNALNVGEILISEGLARPYSGGKRLGWCG